LAAVVFHHSIAMVAAVVFDRQALTRIKQVGTTQEVASIVTNVNLNLWLRKAGHHEHHPQASLHGGLGLRLGQVDNPPQARDAFGSRMVCHVITKLVHGHQPCMKEKVNCYDSFNQRTSSA